VKWILPADLHAFRIHHGLPRDFADTQEVSFAAPFRVAHREASAAGGFAVSSMVRRLDTLCSDSEFLARGGRWRNWYKHSYYHNLNTATQYGLRLGITIDSIEDDLGSSAPRSHTRAQAKRLQRWRLPLFPRIRAMRALRVLVRLRRLVPPRVLAAVLRTWFNGWCTKRRFQGKGECLFGCLSGEDSIDHYMRCTRLHAYGQARLRLPRSDSHMDQGLTFMLLEATSTVTDEVLTRRALLMAAAYRLHRRHRPTR
jgi:hypothetical protein